MLEPEQNKSVIDYLDLIKRIFRDKRTLLKFAGAGLFLGVLIAFTTPKEYESTSFVILEADSGNQGLGQMGAFAGMAGINLPQLQGDQLSLSSELFPEVIQSRDFTLEIMKIPFFFETKGKEMTLEDYYFEEQPANVIQKTINFIISIPSRIIGLFSSSKEVEPSIPKAETLENSYVNVTGKEMYVVGELRKRIKIDQKAKVIELKTSMPEALVSAQVNALVLNKLIEYVTEYKTIKQKRNLEFIEERMEESEKKFSDSQIKLASFRDSNQGMISQRARTREEQLEFEFNIAFNIFNKLKEEFEQSNIQLKRETPIFTVLEHPSVPLGNYKPNRQLILIFSAFMGFFIGILYSVYKLLLDKSLLK